MNGFLFYAFSIFFPTGFLRLYRGIVLSGVVVCPMLTIICLWSENCVSGLVYHVEWNVNEGEVAVTSGAVSLLFSLAAGSVGDPSLIIIKFWLFVKSRNCCPFLSGVVLFCSQSEW